MYHPVVTISTAHWSLYVPHSGHYMYHQFNIQHSHVLPHTAVFMCFVWISEQTAIISLYNINWLVFVTQTENVYCAVRTGYLYITQVKFSSLHVLLLSCRLHSPRGLRRRTVAACLPRLRDREPPAAWISLLCVFRYRSPREESYRVRV